MSRNYDNWERLVAAVIKRDEDRQLCHQLSIRTISMCSEASSMSGFSSSSNYIEVSDDVMFENNQESGDDIVWPITDLVSLKGVCITGKIGKGKFGTSFLTQIWRDQVHVSDHEFLAVGTQLVMKKLLGEVKVTEEEFKTVFANCRHENVAAPRAYCFDNGTYIFSDYNSQGSVYDLLRGKRCPRPNWESRLKIAVGAARGIAHIHGQHGGKMVHGNVISSNIFLNSKQYGCVSDFGFLGIMTMPIYKLKNASQESDVCSFGVVLLQLLFGKSPAINRQGFWKDIHLRPEDWSSKLFDPSLYTPEDWSSELFDRSLLASMLSYNESKSGGLEIEREIKAEMVEMLKVARRCLDMIPQYRPKMLEVVLMLEKIESS